MDNELKVGEVVQLKSGGPKMTITSVGEEHEKPIVSCVWFVGSKEHKGRFSPETLECCEPTGASPSFVDDVVKLYHEA